MSTGARTRVRVTKNKVAPPFREAEFDIMYNEGISKVGDLIDIGTALEIITKRGAFFSYNETRLGQGREQAKNFLKQHSQRPPRPGREKKRITDTVLSVRNFLYNPITGPPP